MVVISTVPRRIEDSFSIQWRGTGPSCWIALLSFGFLIPLTLRIGKRTLLTR